MEKLIARGFAVMMLIGISILLFACAAPTEEPSPPAMLSATDIPPLPQPTQTSSPSPIPPTPTPIRPPITLENVWELSTLYSFTGLGNSIRTVAFDPTSQYLAAITGGNSQGLDHRVRLWSTSTGDVVAQSAEFGSDTWDMAIGPKGDSIAVGLHNGVLTLLSLPELHQIQTFSHAGQVNSVAYSPDGMYIAAGVAESEGGVIYLWNVDQGVLVRRSWAHPFSVPSLAFSPNGQYLASGAVDRSVKIWQISNGQLIRTLEQAGQGTSIRFSSANEWLASGMCAQSTTGYRCVDGQVWLWTVGDWALDERLSGPVDWVESVAFTPDDTLVVGGGRDYGIYLWARSTGSLIRSVLGHEGAVHALAISPDGRFLASGASDESVILWGVSP
jgi:WD40 repeat protein